MEILAVIPARGGSKGLPGKNIRPLAGHPLIAYSIEAAKQTPGVTRIICSTDSEEIAGVARRYGAEVPFLRPDHLAQDMSTDLEVFQHLLEALDKDGYRPDLVLQLRPTSPIRRVSDIIYGIEQMLTHPEADSLRIVTEAPNTPYKMWRLPDEDATADPYLVPLLPAPAGEPEPYNAPRQRLPKTYWQIGTLDVIRPRAIREMNSMSGRKILPLVIDSSLAIDIDDVASFEKAEHTLATIPGLVRIF